MDIFMEEKGHECCCINRMAVTVKKSSGGWATDRHARRLIAAWACGLLLAGCVNPFAPRLDQRSGSADIITQQRTPEDVLQNFRYAYTFKDSLLYADLLDSTFVFEYFDPDQGPSGEFVSWTRDVDLRTTGRLLRAFEVIDLVWADSSVSYALIEGDQALLYRDFNLKLSNFDLKFSIIGYAVLSMRRDPHDNKWRITHWVDESQF